VAAFTDKSGQLPEARSAADSTDSNTLNLIFGDILSGQNLSPPINGKSMADESQSIEGGNILHGGGKNLPELSASASASVPELVPAQDPGAVLASLAYSAITGTVQDKLPKTGGLHNAVIEPPPLAVAPPNMLLEEDSTSPGVDRLASIGEGELLNQGQIAIKQPPVIVASAGKLSGQGVGAAEVSSRITPALGQQVPKNTPGMESIDLSPRQIQVNDTVSEASFEIPEQLSGSNSSSSKIAPANSPPVGSSILLPTGHVDAPVTSKVATGPVMTASPGEANWNNEFASRVSVGVKNGIQEANIQLNPPELGRLEIKISTEGDQTKILFQVQSVGAKDAIEQAMPRLREMLEQDGLQLAHSDVSDHSRSQYGDGRDAGSYVSDPASNSGEESQDQSLLEVTVVASDSVVDYYI